MPSTKSSLVGSKRGFGLLFLAWMVAVTAACLLPLHFEEDSGWQIPYADKITHFTFYAVGMLLGGLGARERYRGRTGPTRPLVFLFASLLAYGLLIEGLQAVLPTGRSAEWWDALANTLGLIAGLASLKWLFHETEFLKWRD